MENLRSNMANDIFINRFMILKSHIYFLLIVEIKSCYRALLLINETLSSLEDI